MGGSQPNNILGPNGAIPQFNGGANWENIVTAGQFQVKSSPGVIQNLGINTGESGATVTLYDGLSAAVAITIATPGVITWDGHDLPAGSAVIFETTGALPTGLTAGTKYYVAQDANLTANTFDVSDTQAHALAGTNQINTSGSQSGTQTAYNVSNKIGGYSAAAQDNVLVGAACQEGILAITTGGSPADITVFYV